MDFCPLITIGNFILARLHILAPSRSRSFFLFHPNFIIFRNFHEHVLQPHLRFQQMHQQELWFRPRSTESWLQSEHFQWFHMVPPSSPSTSASPKPSPSQAQCTPSRICLNLGLGVASRSISSNASNVLFRRSMLSSISCLSYTSASDTRVSSSPSSGFNQTPLKGFRLASWRVCPSGSARLRRFTAPLIDLQTALYFSISKFTFLTLVMG